MKTARQHCLKSTLNFLKRNSIGYKEFYFESIFDHSGKVIGFRKELAIGNNLLIYLRKYNKIAVSFYADGVLYPIDSSTNLELLLEPELTNNKHPV